MKITIIVYLYIKNIINKKGYKVINRKKFEVTHSCIISNTGEYIRDITDLVKEYKVNPKTKKNFYKSLVKDKNVYLHVYLNGDIEIKHFLK